MALKHDEHDHQEVIRQVLSYFVRNCRTADTMEGVARWRLLEERLRRSLRQTETAVTWLVKEGYLEQVVPEGSDAPIFRLKASRYSDAVRFLRGQHTMNTHRMD